MTDATHRLVWANDIHLDCCSNARAVRFVQAVLGAHPDAVLLGGDISTADRLARHLGYLEDALGVPIYFVLGNHDLYRSSVRAARALASRLAAASPRLRWLSETDPVELSPEVALVGHDGWADGAFGDYEGSRVRLLDHFQIADFVGLDSQERLGLMRSLALDAAVHLARVVPRALDRFRTVIVLTHVPPFREATWHEGRISGPEWLPHFSSKVAGDAMLDALRTRPDRRILVLCGHTHGSGTARILPNLVVLTGGAEYGRPDVQRVLDLADLDALFA